MLTAKEIRDVTFEKAKIGGYKTENVNFFIEQVLVSFESLERENAELRRKVKELTAKVEEYKNQEDNIGSVLVNAQKFSDSLYKEAKLKSEMIIKEATAKAEKLVKNAERQISKEADKLKRMQKEVSDFRSRLLAIYKEHIELISVLPSFEEEEESPAPEEKAVEADLAEEKAPEESEKKEQNENPPEDPQEKVAVSGMVRREKKPIEELESDIRLSDLKIVKDGGKMRFKEIKFGKDYDINEDDDY